ncbi:MAG: CPBP family intramembrane metalloprotease, partial [Elusimicrobia bacterium]|nr:CPBP family intramembrane metalloprotease [Elusimicrobiota bacterium]
PRPLARATASGRPASVRERIHGRTVAALRRDGAFGVRERALVDELIGRIAGAGFVARDLNLGNIMIGRRAGETDRRAWLVDALGVFESPEKTVEERRDEMLADPVPFVAVRGVGLSQPLSRALDAAARRDLFDFSALPRPRVERWLALSGLLGALTVAPPLLHAATAAPFAPLSLGLGIFSSWPALVGTAFVLAVAGTPVRVLAHRLAPWMMRRSRGEGAALIRKRPLRVAPLLLISAASEEFLFRALAYGLGAAALVHVLPPLAALSAAAFASSLVFALIHGYGPAWTRVVGGLIYCGALLVSGTLALPIAAHFLFNLTYYLRARYLGR